MGLGPSRVSRLQNVQPLHAGALAATAPTRWIDPVVLDGGLQLAILLGVRLLGKTSLPTRIASARVVRRGRLPDEVVVHVKGTATTPLRMSFDVIWTDRAGAELYELCGLEHHVRLAEETA